MRSMCVCLMLVLSILRPGMASAGTADRMFPMMAFNLGAAANGLQIYLYDPATDSLRDVKVNTTNNSWWPNLNAAKTKLVFAEGTKGSPYLIKVYDVATRATTTCSASKPGSTRASFAKLLRKKIGRVVVRGDEWPGDA